MSRLAFAFTLASASLFAAACGEVTPDPDSIAGDLELENGGLDTTDEAPQFDDPAFVEAALEADADVADPLAADTEIDDLRTDPATQRLRVAVVWGQLPPDRSTPTARVWDGRIAIDAGAIVVRRTIGFEDATDRIAPREVRQAVRFTSSTRPFADGVVLEVLTRAPDLSAVTLTYTSADGATTVAVPLATLLAGPASTDVDALGNRVVVTALRQDDACDHGFMRGRWHQLRAGVGRFMGVVSDADGAPIGHLRGIWGARRNGERVFFAKYISPDGGFRGIFAGHYREGQFAGRWLVSTGDHGRAQGRYRESAPGAEVGGHFVGRWAETSCAADLPADL